MLQRLGRRTAFIGKVGGDAFGAMLAGALREQGICADWLQTDERAQTALAFVQTAADGERRFSFYGSPGADRLLRASEVDPAPIRRSRIFHFGSLSMSFPAAEEATRRPWRMPDRRACFAPSIRTFACRSGTVRRMRGKKSSSACGTATF